MSKLLPRPRTEWPIDRLAPVLSEGAVMLHLHLSEGYVRRANKLTRALDGGKLINKQRRRFELDGARLHALWWANLEPPTGRRRSSASQRRVIEAYGESGATLKRELIALGMSVEGSGWVALVNDKLDRRDGPSLISVLDHSFPWGRYEPLLLIDVWEHAYLLDYGGDRKRYLNEVWKLINWSEVERRLG